MGIDRLDYMVLTHPHPDHMQGLHYVAANFTVGEFWEGGSYPESREYLELMEILRKRRVPVRRISATSAPIEVGGVRIEPLAPFPRSLTAPPVDFYEMNDESLVFRLKVEDFAVLLTGDIGSNIEEHLAAHPELLRCTVLKVPHHGSRYSSSMAFLKAAAPQIAVVSAGYGNSFHLPAQETLDRLQRLGIRLYRTDLDGTIQVISENKRENAVTIRTTGHFR
jgi:competence protein ComEC